MNAQQKGKMGRWYYALAALVLVAGCALAAAILYRGVSGLPAAVANAYDLDRLTQIVMPGTADLTLTRTGAYAVYYEHRSVVDGVAYASDETPPSLACTLTQKATGRDVPLVRDYVETNRYVTFRRQRVGTLMMSTTVEVPGDYTLSCRYPGGSDGPQIVLAIGQNLFFEVMLAVAGTAGALCGSLALAAGAAFVALGITIVVAVRRRGSA